MAETILLAIALKFSLLPLAGWGGSLLALRGRPSGTKSFLGVGCALVGAVGSAYFTYVFFHREVVVASMLIVGGTLFLIVAHIARLVSARRLQRPPGSQPPTLTSRLRKLWRYL